MHDIRLIRENPDAFDAALSRRNIEPTAATILDIDSRRRRLQGEIQDMQSRRNQASKEIGMRKSKGEDADGLIAEVNDIKSRMPALEEDVVRLGTPDPSPPDVLRPETRSSNETGMGSASASAAVPRPVWAPPS